ncbi:DMT family transporter [Algibacter lectus]|uniref:Drug/metabolite transporter (DMT)-like permease n=1 Tax=Algibacter lectus TaxID=221126 RepID=A0A090VFL1_9FLAO|nr:DMT family transporter [Algibacter lectus]MWW24686.1 EamA family transporter [Algibacter lectus]TDY62707.1 drug/metabolite transporter (DMT)-like permease [Algibacter lectus]GAL62848.1 permease of the drug/metabolite transporter (DMT) superfamily [Algibacter lectus]
MNANIYKAHFALFGANVIYGLNYIIAKGIMPHKISPTAFVFIRLACCVVLFWALKFMFVKEKVERKDLLRLALCGLLGAAANMLFFFHGINITSPVDASIIMTATPVLVFIFSFFILKERMTKNKFIGTVIAGIAAIFLIAYGNKSEGTSSLLGNFLVFCNAASYGLYLVLAKTLMRKYNALTVICWMFLFGLLLVTPFSIQPIMDTNFAGFTTNTYLVIGFVVLFTTFTTYLLNLYALNHVMPSVTSSYIYLQPVISFAMVSIYAFILMKEEYAQDINIVKILSCVMVVIGVYIISKPPKKLA